MFRNPDIPFTHNYSQPEEYRFSIDSIEMPWEVAQYLKQVPAEKLKHWNVLDLCAGCGVLGFELNFHIPNLTKIDFVEVQEVYRSHFEKNRELVHREHSEFRFLNLNYEKILLPEFEKTLSAHLVQSSVFFS